MALVITVNISDDEEKCLKYNLLDIPSWVQAAVDGKVNQCKNRLVKEAIVKLKSDPAVTSIPADDMGIINTYTVKPYYLDRTARVAKDKADAIARQEASDKPAADAAAAAATVPAE